MSSNSDLELVCGLNTVNQIIISRPKSVQSLYVGKVLNTRIKSVVDEAEIAIGLEYLNDYKIVENGVVMIVGEIKHVIIKNSDHLQENGEINFQSSNSIGVSGNNTYYELSKKMTLDYVSSSEKFNLEKLLD